MFETFDHTADLGLRNWAADLNTLFAEAGQALFSTIVEDPASVRPERELKVELSDMAGPFPRAELPHAYSEPR
jgi:SHS2 domain-containing protein